MDINSKLNPQDQSQRSGFALILTLFMLASVTLLVFSYLALSGLERDSSSAIRSSQETKLIAEGAVSHAVALLAENIPAPAPLGETITGAEDRAWVTHPGLLRLHNPNSSNYTDIPLHTGVVPAGTATADLDLVSANLNQPLPGSSDPAIAWPTDGLGNPLSATADGSPPHIPPMRVAWVHVPENPSDPVSTDNPVSARYAFWIDDESTRLNYNSAGGKPHMGDNKLNRNKENLETNSDGQEYWADVQSGHPTPDWIMGGTVNPRVFPGQAPTFDASDDQVGFRKFTLGYPRSVNFEPVLEGWQPYGGGGNGSYDLVNSLKSSIFQHFYNHGNQRYPEGILNYMALAKSNGSSGTGSGRNDIDADDREWYQQNKFNLTFASRAPEFNVFGKPRIYHVGRPDSLEGGPSYQQPFHYKAGPSSPDISGLGRGVGGISQMNSVYSTIKHGAAWRDYKAEYLNQILEYLHKNDWPGYEGQSFANKYGADEIQQIALNMMWMGMTSTDGSGHGQSQYMSYVDGAASNWIHTPEKYCWPLADEYMLPQQHRICLTEVCFQFQTVRVKEEDLPQDLQGKNANKWAVRYRWEAEFYVPPYGPRIRRWDDDTDEPINSPYIATPDYLRINARQIGGTNTDGEIGDTEQYFTGVWTHKGRARAGLGNWQAARMRHLHLNTSQAIGPTDTRRPAENFRSVRSRWSYLGKQMLWIPEPPVSVHQADPNDQVIDPTEYARLASNSIHRYQGRLALFDRSAQSIQIDFNHRFGLMFGPRPVQVVPLSFGQQSQLPLTDWPDPLSGAGASRSGDDDTFAGQVTLLPGNSGIQYRGWELNTDPRLSHHASNWSPYADLANGSLSRENNGWSEWDDPKYRYTHLRGNRDWSVRPPVLQGKDFQGRPQILHRRGGWHNTQNKFPSAGYYSLIHTGMQNNDPWATFDFQSSSQPNDLPDWLLMDIFAPAFPLQLDQWRDDFSTPDTFSTLSYLHSTSGKININAKIYPDSVFFDPPQRVRPLRGLFYNLRSSGNDESALVNEIVNSSNSFLYPGEVTQLSSYSGADTGLPIYQMAETGRQGDWQKESILRNLGSLMTTKSNVFGVWGVAQNVKKSKKNTDPSKFEEGDKVTGEKRFYAVVERGIWTGKDGRPGNAEVDGSGKWGKRAAPSRSASYDSDGDGTADSFGLLTNFPGSPPRIQNWAGADNSGHEWAAIDGPAANDVEIGLEQRFGTIPPNTGSSRLEDAYNPAEPAVKYSVLYFKYLDE